MNEYSFSWQGVVAARPRRGTDERILKLEIEKWRRRTGLEPARRYAVVFKDYALAIRSLSAQRRRIANISVSLARDNLLLYRQL